MIEDGGDLFKTTSFLGCVSWIQDVTGLSFPIERFTNMNTTTSVETNAEHSDFLSVFHFPRTPTAVADCLLDDPVRWIGLKVSLLTV